MKKNILLYIILLAAVFSFTSCRKDYTCVCMIDGEKTITEFEQEHKSNVKNSCQQMDAAAKREDPKSSCSVQDVN